MGRRLLLPLALLAACTAGEETPPPPEAATPAAQGAPNGQGATEPGGLTDREATRIAMALWRDDDLVRHPKGSCAGCHGPDFLDLAVIGSTDEDLRRRAVIDGASDQEADALVQAIDALRAELDLPSRDARAFRPFQPGGAVLASSADHPRLAAIERDVAFGRQMRGLLPTLYGPRVGTLAQAKRARAELLDLARGTNEGGANPGLIQLRNLPTGILYPLWSADLHHGAAEGTFNDWLADVAHDPLPEHRRAWLDLQDAYLAEPTRERFWRMYAGAEEMLARPLFAACTMEGTNAHLACGGADDFATEKFLTTLIGQHRLREAAGAVPLEEGPLAYAYLDEGGALDFMADRKNPHLLPAHLWEVGDRSRVALTNSNEAGSFRQDLAELGFPGFVQDSIDTARTAKDEQHALRLAWFWIGFTQDPSFARIHQSNATKTGEYMTASLRRENMFVHDAFAATMRVIASGTLAEANVTTRGVARGVAPAPPVQQAHYSYFVGYGREVPRYSKNTPDVPEALRAEQMALFTGLTANGFRMTLLLHEEALAGGAESRGVPFEPIANHFEAFAPEHRGEDTMLLDRLRLLVGG